MTYQQKLNMLELQASEKSEALIVAVRDDSESGQQQWAIAQAEYEDAENAYRQFMEMIKAQQLSPDSIFF